MPITATTFTSEVNAEKTVRCTTIFDKRGVILMFEGLRHWISEYRARRFALKSPCAAAALIESWSSAGERLRKQDQLAPLSVGEAVAIRRTLDEAERHNQC
jgi:hypothetical protein